MILAAISSLLSPDRVRWTGLPSAGVIDCSSFPFYDARLDHFTYGVFFRSVLSFEISLIFTVHLRPPEPLRFPAKRVEFFIDPASAPTTTFDGILSYLLVSSSGRCVSCRLSQSKMANESKSELPENPWDLPFVNRGISGIVFAIDEFSVIKTPTGGQTNAQELEIERRILERLGEHPRIVKVLHVHKNMIVLERLLYPLRSRTWELRDRELLPSIEEILK